MVTNACASIQNTRLAQPMDEQGHLSKKWTTSTGLQISGEELTSLSSSNFGAIELTFENTTSEWRRIRRVSLDFGGPTKNQFVTVPWGDDIRAWGEATVARNEIAATNRQLALGAVALTGAIVAVGSNSKSVRKAGGLASLSALAAMQVDRSMSIVDSAEHVNIFPEDHLLAGPFAIPPHLFAKKWILFYTKNTSVQPCIDALILTYEFEDRPFERVFLRYKDYSEWQKEACRKKAAGVGN
jgi:hypothetical protein